LGQTRSWVRIPKGTLLFLWKKDKATTIGRGGRPKKDLEQSPQENAQTRKETAQLRPNWEKKGKLWCKGDPVEKLKERTEGKHQTRGNSPFKEKNTQKGIGVCHRKKQEGPKKRGAPVTRRRCKKKRHDSEGRGGQWGTEGGCSILHNISPRGGGFSGRRNPTGEKEKEEVKLPDEGEKGNALPTLPNSFGARQPGGKKGRGGKTL